MGAEDKDEPAYTPVEKVIQSEKRVTVRSSKVDTFKKTQQQLSSSVFDMPEYSEHVPMKKKKLDVNNVNDSKRQKDHNYSDIFGPAKQRPQSSHPSKQYKNNVAPSNWQSPDQKQQFGTHNASSKKKEQQKSALDTHAFESPEK